MEADTVTVTDSEGRELAGLASSATTTKAASAWCAPSVPPPVKPMPFGDSDSLSLRSEAYVAGVGGEKATLKVKVAGRREFAGYWEYLLDNAIFTVPAYPLWGGSALIGMDGTLLGVGSLLVQEALGPGAPAFPGNMYVPINRLKPVFDELVETGRLSTPPRPWLGLYTVEHMGQLVVGGISDGGPADRAGLKRGDILQALNGEVLDDVADFYRKLWASGPAGTAVTLRMERDNDAFEVTVRTGDRAQVPQVRLRLTHKKTTGETTDGTGLRLAGGHGGEEDHLQPPVASMPTPSPPRAIPTPASWSATTR